MSQERATEHGGVRTETRAPRTAGEQDAILEQMERILSHPLFKNSRRYPLLFRYVVEHTLRGDTEHLKERTLGVEVFGREAHYDTNLDPVVRTTAGEIRKRIAQYYHEPGHAGEIRIDIPSGCYVSEFHLPSDREPTAAARGWPPRLAVLPAAAALVLVLGAALAWSRPWASRSALEQFWDPVLRSSSPVLLCVGQPMRAAPQADAEADDPYLPSAVAASGGPTSSPTVRDLHWMPDQNVALSDAVTLTRLAGLLQAKGKAYHVQGEAATTFADLRDGPVVLIGAFNNDWTMRLTGQLHFTFEKDGRAGTHWIQDHQNPSHKDWSVDMTLPYLKVKEDYAIISRVLDPTTDRMVVVAAGIARYGTIAAGEFLTDPAYLGALSRNAPAGWEQKNIQVVIATQVIGGSSGPPRVVASWFW